MVQHAGAKLIVDDVGVGSGVTDRLRGLKLTVTAFQGGAAPSKRKEEKYANAITEA